MLPPAGEEARVLRQGQPVGQVRIQPVRRGVYVAADIISGQPQRDDLVEYTCGYIQVPAAP